MTALDNLALNAARESIESIEAADAQAEKAQYAWASGNFGSYIQKEFDDAERRIAEEYERLTGSDNPDTPDSGGGVRGDDLGDGEGENLPNDDINSGSQ